MPLMRYFIFAGSALLALLFIANASLPALPVAEGSRSAPDLSVIRIHSDNKWPERVVFDTSIPSVTPRSAAGIMADASSPQRDTNALPEERVREAFAQVTPNPSRLEPKRKRKSVAKNNAGPPRLLVAQQPPVAFFGNNTW